MTMKLKNTIMTLTAAVGLTMTAFANIGDTRDEAQARYGRPITFNPDGASCYSSKGWQIVQVYNSQGICFLTNYIRLDGGVITKDQAAAIDTSNFKTLPDSWVYSQLPMHTLWSAADVYSDPRTGYMLIVGSQWINGHWCAYRNVSDKSMSDGGPSTQPAQNSSSEMVPL